MQNRKADELFVGVLSAYKSLYLQGMRDGIQLAVTVQIPIFLSGDSMVKEMGSSYRN